MRHALFLLALLASPALAQIEIENAWTRATPPGAKTAAGYLTIRNKSSSPDHLIRAASPLAARVEMHVHLHDGDMMRMRPVEGYDLRSEEHTSELQSPCNLVCRLLLEKKKMCRLLSPSERTRGYPSDLLHHHLAPVRRRAL